MAKDITLKSRDGSTTYYPKTVSDLVYDNDSGQTVKEQIDTLGSNVSELEEIIQGGNLMPEKIGGCLSTSGGWNNSGECYAIPVKKGDVISIKSNNENKSFWALCATFEVGVGCTFADGMTGVISLGVGSTLPNTTVNEAKFLYVRAADYMPVSIWVNGTNLLAETQGLEARMKKYCEAKTQEVESIAEDANNKVNDILAKKPIYTNINLVYKRGYYYERDGRLVVDGTTTSGAYYTEAIDISELRGQKFYLKMSFAGTGTRTSFIADADGVILWSITEGNMPTVDNERVATTDIPNNAKYLYISFNKTERIVSAYTENIIFDSSKPSYAYVDGDSGSDENSGSSFVDAYKTFSKALNETSNNATIYFQGTTNESLVVNQVQSKSSLRVIGSSGSINRIIKGEKIDNATQYSGNVYYKELISFVGASYSDYYIFQFGVNDEATLILSEEIHPLHRGRTYRNDCQRLIKATSIDEVVNNESMSYYWDASAKKLYFKIKSGTSLGANPIYMPTTETAISGIGSNIHIEICNIDCYFGSIYCREWHGAILTNVSARYAMGAGAIRYDGSVGITLEKCEACFPFTGDGNGDGINAHRTTTGSAGQMRHETATLIDCWCHDCSDDGWSSHDGSECVIRGGLFEYNHKGGVTPSYGTHLDVFNAISRRNNNGFYYISAPTDGDNGGQMICHGCIAMNNDNSNSTNGVGFKVAAATDHDTNTKVICINCVSINNKTGYGAYTYGSMQLIDCKESGSTKQIKYADANSSISVTNNTIVENVPDGNEIIMKIGRKTFNID